MGPVFTNEVLTQERLVTIDAKKMEMLVAFVEKATGKWQATLRTKNFVNSAPYPRYRAFECTLNVQPLHIQPLKFLGTVSERFIKEWASLTAGYVKSNEA